MRQNQRTLCWLIVCLIVAFAAGEAWARAGGGQSYSHSSGNSSGSSSGHGGFSGGTGGGGGGIPVQVLFQFFMFHPMITVLLLIAFVIFVYMSRKMAMDEHQARTIRRGNVADDEARRASALQALTERDPGFDEQAFLARVDVAFRKIQAAWCGQDLSGVHPFISDGIDERFSLQFREQQEMGYRNQLDDLSISVLRLEQATPGQPFDAVTVSIAASAVDYNVSLSDGGRVETPPTPNAFVEYWSFLRRSGTTTKTTDGLVEGCCPNCGAAIDLNQWAQCASCGSLLRSGQYDWVLAEITQECEWEPDANGLPPGVATYQAVHDPGFNQQHLEDRASVIFWRRAWSDLTGSVEPLRKVACDDFCKTVEDEIRSQASAARTFWGNCAVGSVDLRGVVAGEPWDRTLIEVRWSARPMRRQADGPPAVQPGVGEFRTLFVLGRKPGVKSSVDASLTSANCPGCGAPESNSTANACEFCGLVLNDGSADWVLLEALPMQSNEAAGWIAAGSAAEPSVNLEVVGPAQAQALSGAGISGSAIAGGAITGDEMNRGRAEPLNGAPEGAALLGWLVKMVNVDNDISDRERQTLQRFAERQGMPPARLNAMIDAAVHDALRLPEPANPEQGRMWLTAMADMSLVDGKVTRQEFDLLSGAAARLGIDRGKVKELLRARKRLMYENARQRLKKKNKPE